MGYLDSGRNEMSANIRKLQYFYVMIEDRPGAAFEWLSQLASEEVNLLAFSAVPTGPTHTQLTIYPESAERLVQLAEKTGSVLYGPHTAFLISGDDKLGALVDIHHKLTDADINVVTSSGVSTGKGSYGYLLHVRPENCDEVTRLLGL